MALTFIQAYYKTFPIHSDQQKNSWFENIEDNDIFRDFYLFRYYNLSDQETFDNFM